MDLIQLHPAVKPFDFLIEGVVDGRRCFYLYDLQDRMIQKLVVNKNMNAMDLIAFECLQALPFVTNIQDNLKLFDMILFMTAYSQYFDKKILIDFLCKEDISEQVLYSYLDLLCLYDTRKLKIDYLDIFNLLFAKKMN